MEINRFTNKTLLVFWTFAVVFVLYCTFFSQSFAASDDKKLKIHFIDVGEGDSILIEAPDSKSILIDAGNLITGHKVVKYLKERGITYLDHLIFTHLDLDHIGGSFFVVQNFDIGRIYDTGQDFEGTDKKSDPHRWYKDLIRSNDGYTIIKEGDNIELGEANLDILWPNETTIQSNYNFNSLAIMVKYKSFRCLLAADLPMAAEKELLKKDYILKSDVLKVGHHGSDYANSFSFLQNVLPKISIISVDEDNLNQYPSEKTIDKLMKIDSEIYYTYKSGDIVVIIDDMGDVLVREEKVER